MNDAETTLCGEKPANAVERAIELLKSQQQTIEYLEQEISRLRVKADAFDILSRITSAVYGGPLNAEAARDENWYVQRTVEDLVDFLHPPKPSGEDLDAADIVEEPAKFEEPGTTRESASVLGRAHASTIPG